MVLASRDLGLLASRVGVDAAVLGRVQHRLALVEGVLARLGELHAEVWEPVALKHLQVGMEGLQDVLVELFVVR